MALLLRDYAMEWIRMGGDPCVRYVRCILASQPLAPSLFLVALVDERSFLSFSTAFCTGAKLFDKGTED